MATPTKATQVPEPTAEVRDARMWKSADGGVTWTPHDGGSSGGGATATVGADVPSTAVPILVKDSAGKAAYIQMDGAGNIPVSVTGAGSGGTSAADGAGYAAGTTAGTPLIGARDDSSPGTVAEDKLGIVRITTNRGLHVNVRNASGVEVTPATDAKQDTGNTSLGNIDTNAGATTDSAVTGDNTGSLSAKLRGLSKMLSDMWDSGNHRLNVFLQNTSIAVTRTPSTSGGTLCYHKVSAGSTNADVVKASAGQLYTVKVFNKAAYPVYVKFFNKATTPDPTADTVLRTVGIQAGVRAEDVIPDGMPFSTGIAIAIVKDIADNGGTAVAAADCVVDVDYK